METIKIGPIFFQVVIKTDEEMTGDDGQKFHGQTRNDFMEIWINERHTKESHFVTKWHEVLHCIADMYGVKLSESAVTALASGICQALQDNPDLNWTSYDAATQ